MDKLIGGSKLIVYTDGSCSPQRRIGSWAAVILKGDEKITLNGADIDTTNQRMELTAVLKSLAFLQLKGWHEPITIYTDSQYVVGLPNRKAKLKATGFVTKKLSTLNNSDLIKELFRYLEEMNVTLTKVKAHANSELSTLNREVDMFCRKQLRALFAKSE